MVIKYHPFDQKTEVSEVFNENSTSITVKA